MTTTTRDRNRRGEGGRLRADILAAAAEILDESGREDAVTLRAVARKVGIAAPSIYGHFPDRDAILLAVVQQAFDELGEHLAAAAQGDPATRLRAVCSAYLGFAEARPQRYRIMLGGVWDATDAVRSEAVSLADVTELGQDSLRVFSSALADCVAAGVSGSTDPDADAVALWVGLHGLAHQRAVSRSFPWPADIAERLVDSVAHLGQPAGRRLPIASR